VLPYISPIVIQIGAAAVPPIGLLAAVHGIALAVRSGASGRVYCWAVSAMAAIGVGAFAPSFLALRDLMQVIGYSSATGWIFPAIIDTAVAVSTLMLVALGDKPARRTRNVTTPANTQAASLQRAAQTPVHRAKAELKPSLHSEARARTRQVVSVRPAAAEPDLVLTNGSPTQTEAIQVDADLASELIASGVTTQSVETVVAVLSAIRGGASINAAAKASGINYRTAQRIVQAVGEHQQHQLLAVG
jgi:hypothetical protein